MRMRQSILLTLVVAGFAVCSSRAGCAGREGTDRVARTNSSPAHRVTTLLCTIVSGRRILSTRARPGNAFGKAEIMANVKPEPNEPETTYSAEDIRIQQYGTTAIVAFRLVGKTKKGNDTQVANFLNTGTFLKRNGKWQAVAWQATKVPRTRG